MPHTFPILSSGSMKVYGDDLLNSAIVMYPSALGFEYTTRVLKFINDSEQRFTVKGELFMAVLE